MGRADRFNVAAGILLLIIGALVIGAAAQTPPYQAYEANNPNGNSKNFFNMFARLTPDKSFEISEDASVVKLKLDAESQAAFGSFSDYSFGYYSMQMKLCKGYTAGTITAFYVRGSQLRSILSSRNMSDNHDEFDFEFLGNVSGHPYALQTNVFVNGVSNREMRHYLWFDPTVDFHIYSLLWNNYMVAFYIDSVPLRVFLNHEAKGQRFPRKSVGIFGSLWDGSEWATQGGKIKMDPQYAPYIADVRAVGAVDACQPDLSGSVAHCQDPANPAWWNQPEYHTLSPETLSMLTFVKKAFCIYDYCTDYARFPDGMPPECALLPY